MAAPAVRIIRNGNYLTLDSVDHSVWRAALPALRYTELTFHYGKARKQTGQRTSSTVQNFYEMDAKGRPFTTLGLFRNLRRALERAGYRVEVDDRTKYPRPDAYQFDWDRLAAFMKDTNTSFRPGQKEALETMVKFCNGRFSCPPAWGKSFLFKCACVGFSKAKIIITTKSAQVMNQRIYPDLVGVIPGVGLVNGSTHRPGRRVTCVTSQSLHHETVDKHADIVLDDECHEAGADSIAESLILFPHAHMFGFSGSQDMRIDGKDFVIQSLFGPIRFERSYAEAVEDKAVVPTEIHWRSVEEGPSDAVLRSASDVQKKRLMYWANDARNEAIAADARKYGPDVQVLITAATTEHVLRLKQYLPEFKAVYGAGRLKPHQIDRLVREGVISEDFKPITDDQLIARTKAFETGKLKKAIVTTLWNAGVDFTGLSVVCRADGGSGKISSIQITGRPARIKEGKCRAVIHEYLDQFCESGERMAQDRSRTYGKQGYKQVYPPGYSSLKRTRRKVSQ